ncbi:MAG: AgmX/PglI C-terminal domain-containing protein [Archangiaceae bacterium]|nr:AgmX/PglI C-terminal domain-containing protein [Archangiaceae bacterium]
MVSADDVERLSRLLAGDLSAAEEAALRGELSQRPALEQALARLKALDAMTASFAPAPRDVALAEQAAQRLAPPLPRVAWRPVAAAAVLAAALAASVTAWVMSSEAPAPVAAPAPVVSEAPAPVTPLASEQRASPALIRTALGQLELLDGAQVTPLSSGVFRLEHGNVLAQGRISIEVEGHRIDVDGKVLIATEPEKAQPHVTAPMNRQLLAGTAVVLFVMQGNARATEPAFEVKNARPNVALDRVPKPAEMLSLKEMNDAVAPHSEAIGGCFAQALKANPRLQGKVTLLLTLKSDGKKSRLTEGTVAGDYSLQNPFVASCVLEQLGAVEFPAPRGADEVQVAYPLEFQPRGTGTWVALPDDGVERKVAMTARPERVDVELGDAPQTLPGAKVTVVEFSEHGCSFCLKGAQLLSTLRHLYRDRVNFVFKHHPLPSEPRSDEAARAMVAAHRLGRFWEFHDELFKSPNVPLETAARVARLDVLAFNRLRASDEVKQAVERDVAQAQALESRGVPSYFVNGREVVGLQPTELRKLIDAELAAAKNR